MDEVEKQGQAKKWTCIRTPPSLPSAGCAALSPLIVSPLATMFVRSLFVCSLARLPYLPRSHPPAVSPRKLNCVADLQPDVTDPTHPGLSPAPYTEPSLKECFFLSPEMSNSRYLSLTVENPHHYHYNNPNRPRSVAGRPSPRREQAH